jgi:hypothetical protein
MNMLGAPKYTVNNRGMSLPSASAPVDKRTSASVIPGDYDYSSGLIPPKRVLTFNNAGLG